MTFNLAGVVALFALLISVTPIFGAPSKLVLQNQFGETSVNVVQGAAMPLVPGSSNIVTLSGTGAPTNGTSGTGHGVAGPGSLYIRTSNGAYYVNTNTLASPTWTVYGTADTSALLTGFVFAPGAVAASDTILQAFAKIGPVESAPSLTFDHSVGAKTITVRQVGKLVNVRVPAGAITDGLGTVCATTAGLAAGFRPSAAVTFSALVIDNGTTRKAGQLVVGADGVLTFSVLGTGFTNAAAAGWDSIAVSYPVP